MIRAGSQSPNLRARTVTISGPGGGLFVYSPVAGASNLVVSVAGAAGTDPYGNPYAGPGISLSAPGAGAGQNVIELRPDLSGIFIYAPSG